MKPRKESCHLLTRGWGDVGSVCLHAAGIVIATFLFANSALAQLPWELPGSLSPDGAANGKFDVEVSIAQSGDTIIAVWSSSYDVAGSIGTDFDILFSRSTDGGTTWSDPFWVNTYANNDNGVPSYDRFPSIATNGAGEWAVVWQTTYNKGGLIGTDSDIMMAFSFDDGTSFTASEVVSNLAATDGTKADNEPVVVSYGEGSNDWMVTWEGTINSDTDILYMSYTGSGGFGTTAALNTDFVLDGVADRDVDLATDGAGNWVAAWTRNNDDIAYARSSNDGASWSAPLALNGAVDPAPAAGIPPPESVASPRVAAAPRSNLVWRCRTRIRAQPSWGRERQRMWTGTASRIAVSPKRAESLHGICDAVCSPRKEGTPDEV